MRRRTREILVHAAAAALAAAIALGARPAEAHLMAAGQGTVNVVGAEVFAVLSVPTESLQDADDNHDGLLDLPELERHEAALREEIDRRLVLLDGATPARTVRVDIMLSPEHGAPGDRADRIVVLKHAELPAPPADLRVRCDLFGARASDRELTLTATRHPASGTETQLAVLTPEAPEHAFFPPPRATSQQASHGGLGGVLLASAVFALAMAGLPRKRKPEATRSGSTA